MQGPPAHRAPVMTMLDLDLFFPFKTNLISLVSVSFRISLSPDYQSSGSVLLLKV